jgi:hypothetical protein
MTAIDKIDHDPDEWWGFSPENGWVVLDRKDERNLAGELLTFVRCGDWSEFECPGSRWPSSHLVFFRTHLKSLEGEARALAIKELLVTRKEYAGRKAGFREIGLAWDKERREEARQKSEQAEERRRSVVAAKHRAYLAAKGFPASGVQPSTVLKRKAWCSCGKQPGLDGVVVYACETCTKDVCPRCGACQCGYAPTDKPRF